MSENNSNEDQNPPPTERVVSIRGVVFEVPTASRSGGEERVVEFDTLDLTESSMDLLRQNDPFMYYSIFSPNHYPIDSQTEFHLFLLYRRYATNVNEAPPERIQRQSRISAECDAVTFMWRIVLNENNNATDNHELGYESGDGEEKELIDDESDTSF